MKIMLSVAKRRDRCVRIGTNCLPDSFAASQEAKVVDTFRMVLRYFVDQGIVRSKSPIAIPDRISE